MTYEETVLCLVCMHLMYVAHEDHWLDLSLCNLTGNWLRHVEEHFAGVNGGGPKVSILQSYLSLNQPVAFVSTFFEKYPVAKEQLLAHEDVEAIFDQDLQCVAILQSPGASLQWQ